MQSSQAGCWSAHKSAQKDERKQANTQIVTAAYLSSSALGMQGTECAEGRPDCTAISCSSIAQARLPLWKVATDSLRTRQLTVSSHSSPKLAFQALAMYKMCYCAADPSVSKRRVKQQHTSQGHLGKGSAKVLPWGDIC